MLFLTAIPGLAQTKVSLRRLEANGFPNGCVVATSGALATQACGSGSGAGDAVGFRLTKLNSNSTIYIGVKYKTAEKNAQQWRGSRVHRGQPPQLCVGG
jgi:hypothetical protein